MISFDFTAEGILLYLAVLSTFGLALKIYQLAKEGKFKSFRR